MTTAANSANWLTGYIADLPTPFDADGALDLAAFANLCERQIAAGAPAIVVSETAGEASTLSPVEQDTIIRTAVKVAHGRLRVIAGVTSNATSKAIALARQAEAAGADAILSVVPYYNKPMQSGIEAHFLAIAASTELPIILHDVPARTNRELADTTLWRLARSRRFIGLKDTTGDVSRVARLRQHLPAGFHLMSGDDASALGYIASGGDGCISMISNVAPGLCRTISACCRRENWQAARGLHMRLAPLEALLSREGPPALKAALSGLGLMRPDLRLPLVGPESAIAREVARTVAAITEQDLAASIACA
jgi:4-hydroxy-tetrahydrodipicolinate synthase